MADIKKRGIVRWRSGLLIGFFVVALGACNLILDNEPGKLADDDGAEVGGDGDGDSDDGDGDGSGGMDGTGGESGGSGGSGEECVCDEEETCQGGACYPWECEPGEDFCSSNQVRSCAEDGLSSTVEESCGDNQYCHTSSAECRDGVCAPGEATCVQNRATWCNEVGTGFLPGGTNCGSTASCEGGECKPHVCVPGAKFCQFQQLKQCAENGLNSTTLTNCSGQACVETDGTASCQGSCTPGQTQCSKNSVNTCGATGQWGSDEPCSSTHCASGACAPSPPSCQGLPVTCGPGANESCCTSPLVVGGIFKRINNESYPATISDFRLDKYEVTVGRFRQFVDAAVMGWRPAAGAGKHVHLSGGSGLANSHSDSNHEPGWNASWNVDNATYRMHASKASWDTSLSCDASWQTWTATPEENEHRPITCVNWYQAYAFCIWDGGFLPTEAEWNYAAAGGGDSEGQRTYPWSNPSTSALIDCSHANYRGLVAGTEYCHATTRSTNVGMVSPKGDGRYGQSDLSGNVWEWTLDQYAASAIAFQGSCSDCAYLPDSAANRVVWGGAYISTASGVVSSARADSWPTNRWSYGGLRCARTP